ncbi:MAG: hypothetical protein AM325_012430 [Candidatus Thorarchaeota archaeon SMTZ1-45]|nr:MAG: hypothetical protein AM325_14115 [Candidatus Thorarchaeota archaeon SMTZ1-45]
MYLTLRYPTPTQGLIWLKRRQKVRPSRIAKEFDVSRPFVSQAQRIAEGRIRDLLNHTASINRIKLRKMSGQYGFAVGFCPAQNMDAYILYSPTIGIQVWFDHEGECDSCTDIQVCKETLTQLGSEWEIPLKRSLPPSELSGYLFGAIMRRLEWVT